MNTSLSLLSHSKHGNPLAISVAVTGDVDIVVARQEGRALAHTLGFNPVDVTLIVTAISELARNIVQYAKTGDILMAAVQTPTRRGVQITARDSGPGIADIELAMTEGFSTSGGLGLGLSGVKRLMDDFEIVSKVGGGTSVTVKRWRAASCAAAKQQ